MGYKAVLTSTVPTIVADASPTVAHHAKLISRVSHFGNCAVKLYNKICSHHICIHVR